MTSDEICPVLIVVAGSRAYGINTETSDVDVKGVCFGPKLSYLGFNQREFKQIDSRSEVDKIVRSNAALNVELSQAAAANGIEGTIYEIRRFFELAAKNNPNILDALFCDPKHIVSASPVGLELRRIAPLFISSKCKQTFSGYAMSQLKRMSTHRKWLLSPPAKPPTRAEFGLPETTPISKEEQNEVLAAVRKKIDEWNLDLDGLDFSRRQHILDSIETYLGEFTMHDDAHWIRAARAIGVADSILETMRNEKNYRAASANWDQFSNWKKNRNQQRAELEARFGYDTKHAVHLVRLMTMAKEILTTGEVRVNRDGIDSDFLKEVRAGVWDYDTLIAWAKARDAELNEIYNAKSYSIPRVPPVGTLDEHCARLVHDYLRS